MKSYKKILLVLLVAVFGMGMAQAQIRFGVKAGLNLNSLHFNDVAKNFDSDNKCGYTIGVMTEFKVPVIGLGFDLSAMYTRMNSGVEENMTQQTDGKIEDRKIGKNFLEIPLNLKYKFGLPIVDNIFTPYIFTGPSFAIKLDKNTVDSFRTKTCQVAWNVGLGFELVRHLQISGSYGFGMNNVAKYMDINAEQVKVKNNYWTVTAAYLF